jgi:hypothetical protein
VLLDALIRVSLSVLDEFARDELARLEGIVSDPPAPSPAPDTPGMPGPILVEDPTS